jgi:hypothetical protein
MVSVAPQLSYCHLADPSWSPHNETLLFRGTFFGTQIDQNNRGIEDDNHPHHNSIWTQLGHNDLVRVLQLLYSI